MMADDQALQRGRFSHVAGGSRGRTQAIAPYQPHGFTRGRAIHEPGGILLWIFSENAYANPLRIWTKDMDQFFL